MPFEHYPVDLVEFARLQAEEKQRAAAERARLDAEELATILRESKRKGLGHDVDLNLRLAAYWTRVYTARLIWLPDGAVPYCVRARREVGAWFPETPEKTAVLAHEISHLIVPPCPGPPRHAAFIEDNIASCLECEILTTEQALRLFPAGFERLAQGLRTYRSTVPAAPRVLAACDRLLSGVTYAEARQRRAEFDLRVEQQRAVERDLAVIRRAEIRRWEALYGNG
jgi:hypothetical protein